MINLRGYPFLIVSFLYLLTPFISYTSDLLAKLKRQQDRYNKDLDLDVGMVSLMVTLVRLGLVTAPNFLPSFFLSLPLTLFPSFPKQWILNIGKGLQFVLPGLTCFSHFLQQSRITLNGKVHTLCTGFSHTGRAEFLGFALKPASTAGFLLDHIVELCVQVPDPALLLWKDACS